MIPGDIALAAAKCHCTGSDLDLVLCVARFRLAIDAQAFASALHARGVSVTVHLRRGAPIVVVWE